uniref:Uncharacterized protein n=1 Tax=Meloidogyne incognita TaxID=6306 RepID=A0A914KWD0_MELIC
MPGRPGFNNSERSYSSEEMINTLTEKNQPFGIYSSVSQWKENTGNVQKYNEIPMWYAHYDKINNFNDYYNSNKYKFGGWINPTIKQYYNNTLEEKRYVCRVNVDYNWRP